LRRLVNWPWESQLLDILGSKDNLGAGRVNMDIQPMPIRKDSVQLTATLWWSDKKDEPPAARAEQFPAPRACGEALCINLINFL